VGQEDRVIGAIATAQDSRPKGVDPLKDPTEKLDFTTKPTPRSDPSDPSDPCLAPIWGPLVQC